VAVLSIVAALASPLSFAQGPGGMPSMPASMFGGKKETRVVSGPSLSATDEPVAEIRIVGNKTIPTTQILNELQTRVGRPFDPALVQRDVRKLAARGWFVDVRPRYEQADRGRVVIFEVVERPVIRYVEYLGNHGIRTKKLAKETDLKVGGSVDPSAVEEGRRKLISLYQRNGFNNAQVTILEGNKATDQGVVYVINEGAAQKVWKVEFEGNAFASDGQLRTKIETKRPTLMVFKGFLDRETLDGDVDRLTAYYRSYGFFQAKVGRQLIFNNNSKWVTLRFVIHEGPRYDVEEVAFLGNRLFASESLAMGVKTHGGTPFEQAKMNADVAWLKELYGSQGYVFADIQAEPIFLEESGKLKLLYKIEEGKRWRIGNIYVHINGENPHTKIQTALNRLSIRSGEIADIREINASERRLRASGLFMNDPIRGVVPKITYRIQELNESQLAEGSGSFRGQSPDNYNWVPDTESGLTAGANQSRAEVAERAAASGPPLIAPPASPATQSFRVQPSPGFVPADDQINLHVHLEDAATEELASSPVSVYLSPAAQRHEVRWRPLDESAQPSAYQHLTVRTQSPYQPPSTGSNSPASPAPGFANSPVAVTAERYAAAGYGGQAVGATEPDAVPAGSNRYAVQQATAASPQSAQPQYATQAQYAAPPNGPAAFGPPPMLPPPPQQYGAPPVTYGAGPGAAVLAPDPNITPVTPLPTNPALTPYPADPFTPMFTDPAVDLDVVLSEAQTGRLMLGVAVNSDAGLVGQILLDEQNFDWTRLPTSWDDFASGRAWRGAGQRFRIEAAPGTHVHRYLVSFQEPYLMDTPVSLGLSGSFFNRRYRDWDEQRLGGRVSTGYQWVENDVSAAISYRGEEIKISDLPPVAIPELEEVRGSNALHGFKLTLANDTRDSPFLATEGHFLQLELEQVVGSFTYPRAILEGRRYFLLHERPDHSGRHVVTLASRAGFSGSDTPIYEHFFAGGYSTLRGFDFRGASPVVSGVQVGGEFMWVNTVEYLFPLTADDMIHGVAFVDFGTVERRVEIEDFRVAPGFGLRITVPAMGPAPIALDFAFPILHADFDDKQVFSFNMGLQR
jgi:outer membrane protein insertion porin family